MKKIATASAAIIIAFILISWGRTGHSTIGLIAENHLNAKAKAAVASLLNGQSLADVASWADDNRTPQTAPWHFINVEPGLSFDDFKQEVESKADVYTVLVKQEGILADSNTSREDRATALKYIVHFVGDIHQPMHVSRAEDKGGNSIELIYDGQATNLHALWDTKMLEHAGLSPEQLALEFDKATPRQISQWQGDPQITWAWESYQISTQLYAEVAAIKGGVIDNTYYAAHMPVVENRIEKAGIRLAGVLNTLFSNAKPIEPALTTNKAAQATVQQPIPSIKAEDAASHIGQTVSVSAKVFGHRDFGSMVLVNLGAAYPDSPLTLVLRDNAKSLGSQLDGKTITVTGQLSDYKGKPEIVVSDTSQLKK